MWENAAKTGPNYRCSVITHPNDRVSQQWWHIKQRLIKHFKLKTFLWLDFSPKLVTQNDKAPIYMFKHGILSKVLNRWNNMIVKLNFTCSCSLLHLCRSARNVRKLRFPLGLWAGYAGCILWSWSACGWHHSRASVLQRAHQSPAFNKK